MASLVGSALFGDGAAAVVAVGEDRAERDRSRRARGARHPQPDVSRLAWAPWGGRSARNGFQLVLSPTCPSSIDRYLGDDMDGFLGDHGLDVDDIATWVSHPGGPKVIEAITATLGLGDDALELTWRSLAEVGNLSSSSVLHVLRDTIAKKPAGRRRPAC